MKWMIVLGIAGFLLGIGGATGAVVVQTRSAAASAPDAAGPGETEASDAEPGSSPVQFLAVATGGDELAVRDSIALDSARVMAADRAAPPAPDEPTRAIGALPYPPRPYMTGGDDAEPAGGEVDLSSAPALPQRRIGKIFASMQPKEAARVLEQMNDRDVSVILGMMGDRQAASVLSNLPPQRAASISQQAIRGRGTAP